MRTPKRENDACDPVDTATLPPTAIAKELGVGRRVGEGIAGCEQKQQSSVTPYGERGIKDVNTQTARLRDLVPDSRSAYERKEFREPRNLQLPI